MIEMKTLTINEKVYEVFDEVARTQISMLKSKSPYTAYSVMAPASLWVQQDNGSYVQDILLENITDSDVLLDLDTSSVNIENANSVLNAYSKLWCAETYQGYIRLTCLECPSIDIPLKIGTHE